MKQLLRRPALEPQGYEKLRIALASAVGVAAMHWNHAIQRQDSICLNLLNTEATDSHSALAGEVQSDGAAACKIHYVRDNLLQCLLFQLLQASIGV